MTEEKEKTPAGARKKRKYVYLEKFEAHNSILNERLEHLESMNYVHWAFHICVIVAGIYFFVK